MGYSISLTNWRSGLWNESLSGQIKDEGYISALLQCENFFISGAGGSIKKRQGTEYIDECVDPANTVKLIAFNSSATGKYIIECGNNYMRMFDTDGNITCTGIASPYSSDDLEDIKYTQLDEDIYIVHNSYPVKKLTLSGTSWSIVNASIIYGPFLDENENDTSTISITGNKTVGSTVILTATDDVFNTDHVGAYWKFVGYSSVSGTLSNTGATTDSIKIDNGESLIVNLLNTWSGTCVVQRSTDDGDNWSNYTEYNETTQSTVTEPYADNVYYRICYQNKTSGNINASLVHQDVTGYVEITEYTSSKVVTATVIKELPEQLSLYKWSEGAFSEYRGYPRAITIAQQRMFLAGTIKNPNTIFVTKTGKYENFDIGVVNADDGMVLKIASRRSDEVLSMLTYDDSVHIFTDGMCYRLSGSNGVISPTSIDISNDVFVASYPIQAYGINSTILFVEQYGKTLNHKYYDSDKETYVVAPINEQISEMFETSTIIDMDYAHYPNNLIYIIKSDGEIAVCNHKYGAWSKFTTNGTFESACVIPGENEHDVWFVVNRNGSRYIEKMSSSLWTDMEDYNYLDSSVSYSSPNYYFQGLDHLEGMEVQITSSGGYVGTATVSEGQVVLGATYGGVIIGLGYESILETMPIEIQGNYGNSQGRNSKISDVSIKVRNTLGLSIGATEDVMDDIPNLESGVTVLNEPLPLYTGLVPPITFPAEVSRENTIIIKNTTPTPVEILTIIPEIVSY